MTIQTDLEKYLKKQQVNAFDLAKDFQAAHDHILFGETHVGLEKKARFFARLINANHVRYHASEHFLNHKSR